MKPEANTQRQMTKFGTLMVLDRGCANFGKPLKAKFAEHTSSTHSG